MVVFGVDFPEAVARCFEPSAPLELRLQTARGAIPLPPVQRLASLAFLSDDADEAVREASRSALEALPDGFLLQGLSDASLPALAVDAVARVRGGAAPVLSAALRHANVEARTVERFLGSSDAEVVATLSRNQRFFDRNPELARRLTENPLLPAAERSRLTFVYGSPEDELIAVPLEAEAPLPEDLPQELLYDDVEPAELTAGMTGEVAAAEPTNNLYQYVQTLKVSEKIKLAMLGSKAARRLLIRDTNKLVAVAVIRSPKIRDDEVASIAQDRTIAEEVIRIILNRKDWLKSYPLRLALAQNPKTAVPRAIRLLETLQEKDLRQISKSRNVPGAVATTALRILARRGKA